MYRNAKINPDNHGYGYPMVIFKIVPYYSIFISNIYYRDIGTRGRRCNQSQKWNIQLQQRR